MVFLKNILSKRMHQKQKPFSQLWQQYWIKVHSMTGWFISFISSSVLENLKLVRNLTSWHLLISRCKGCDTSCVVQWLEIILHNWCCQAIISSAYNVSVMFPRCSCQPLMWGYQSIIILANQIPGFLDQRYLKKKYTRTILIFPPFK